MIMISELRWAATANASRTNIPDEYRFTGVSMNSPTSENAMISSIRSLIAARFMPRIAPFIYTFSRPVSSP